MSKAVLISIRPKWVEKIANGEKLIEVRKTRPKLQTPFKCYIYCTMPETRDPHNILELHGVDGKIRKANGKVIGEFTCDQFWIGTPHNTNPLFCMAACMDGFDTEKYAKGKTLYGWHIFDLRIYDIPRELSEFQRATDPCDSCHAEYTWECTGCKKLSGDIKRPPQSWCYVEAMKDG